MSMFFSFSTSKMYIVDWIKKSRMLFSWEPGKTSRASGYSFFAANIEARESKSAFTCVVITSILFTKRYQPTEGRDQQSALRQRPAILSFP